MRQFKFRCWSSYENRMFDWNEVLDYSATDIFTPNELTEFAGGLMQYTGLKDKNGKDIYEGDIVDHNNLRYVIQWNNAYSCFEIFDGEEGSLAGNIGNHLEVVGNIYENKNLLK